MTITRRTFEQWANDWPYGVTFMPNGTAHTPCNSSNDCEELYREAFMLTDYFVSSITGGSMWFARRKRVLSATGPLQPGEEIQSRGTDK